jgi:multiple sugar transport system permease protein
VVLVVTQSPADRDGGAGGNAMMRNRSSLPLVFVGPSAVILIVMAAVPTVFAINIALEDRTLSDPTSQYIWLENFARLFSDRRFINSIVVSLTWELITVTATMVCAVLLAILMFEAASPRVRNTLSLIFLMPVLLPRVSAAFVWKFAFHPLFGLVTYPFRAITGQTIDLLAGPSTALGTVALVDVWQWALFFSIIILKLLETLPPEPFEAAKLDHAKMWEIYAYIAIPMLRAPLISLVFVKMIESLRAFDLIYVMTRGGPGITTETLDMYAFSQGFIESGNISYASSMAVLMTIATTVAFTILWKRVRT